MNIINIKKWLSNKKAIRNVYNEYRKRIYYRLWKNNPMKLADKLYYQRFARHINWNCPTDMNEKINWLKFHADQHVWADLADKFKVREFVEKSGLSDILIPLYGVYKNAEELIKDWDNLPEEFVIKSNNGSAHVIIISNDKEVGQKKNEIRKTALAREIKKWLNNKAEGVLNAEMHYQYISNCIVVEKLLIDNGIKAISRSPIDYKFFCADGEPYMCYVAYNRDPITHDRIADMYDLNWIRRDDLLSKGIKKGTSIPKPQNWERMKEIASILSTGHYQVRIDLYNIEGKIYFGEMTFTNSGGFDNEFTQTFLNEFGNKIVIC